MANNDFRFQLRGGTFPPPPQRVEDSILKKRELGYCDDGIIYSVDK